MVKIKRKLVSWAGVLFLQPFYERLTFILMRLMNYGAANHPSDSGEFRLLKRLQYHYFLNSPTTILDVGANIGQFAIGASKIIQNSTVHCFEPSSATFQKLKTKSTDRILVNHAGLGASRGSKLLYEGQDRSVKASFVLYDQSGEGELAQVWTVDSYCLQHNLHTVELLKIDVEGFELEVLKGAKDMIDQGKIKFIQFEFGGINHVQQKVFLQDFFDFLPQYSIYRILQRGLVKLSYKPFYEIYITSNYLAVQKSMNQHFLKS